MSKENQRKLTKPAAGKKVKNRSFRPKQTKSGAPARAEAVGKGAPAPETATSNVSSTNDPYGNAQNYKTLGKVVLRNEFYRDGFRALLILTLLEAVIIIGLILSMLFVIHVHQPENRYFATTEDGRLMPMVGLHEPNLSTPALMSWVAQASTEVMTFGFNDYKRRLQEASRHFTRTGWTSFTQALQSSRIIEIVETNQQILTAVPQGAPLLQAQGEVNGRYQWTVQVPMILTYRSGSVDRSDRLLVTAVVVRQSRLETPNGVGIEQWIAAPR